MDRRDFLRRSLITTGGIAAVLAFPGSINNTIVSPTTKIFSTNLDSLEKVIMAGKILRDENPESLINLHSNLNQKPNIGAETEKINEEIKRFLIEKIKQFSRKAPSKEKLYEIRDEIDKKYQEIRIIKENERITFVDFKRKVFISSEEGFLKSGDSELKEFYKFGKDISLLDSLARDEEANPPIQRLYKTLVNLSPDSLFISEASKISRVPIEEILAFAYVESVGRPFAIGREGEINTFQLHPKYLDYIHQNALLRKNLLSDYIEENTSKRTLLEDLAGNSRLNTAMAVNLMKFLKEETKTYYEYVLSYNIGVGGVGSLSQKTRRKLENPERISNKDMGKRIFGYYTGFLNAKNAFEQMKEHLGRIA